MPDDVVGSARIRIEPDFTGFDAALEAGVTQAADQAAEAIVTAFRAAAQTSADELSQIGQAGFVDVTATADTAAQDLEAAFSQAASEADSALSEIGAGAGDAIASEFATTGEEIAGGLITGADEATAALESIGVGAGEQVAGEFAGVGAQIAGDIEAGANEAQAALESIGEGAGDQLAGEFAGAGEAISSTVQSGASQASAALSALEGAGQGVVENLAQGFEGLGGIIAAAVVGIGIAGAFSAAEEVASIAGLTNQLLETTGNVAGITAEEIVGLGDSLEGLTGVESELTQEAANVLLTFKNVRNEVGLGNDIFNRAIRAGGDLSAVLGGEVSGAALQLGKALQDPIKGLSVLGRAGVTFTADQKELVRSFVEQGDLLSAQKVILGELEGQVGGAAEASAKASDRIRASLGNISEEIGAGLLPAADELADRLPGIVEDIGPAARELGEAFGEGLGVAVDALLSLAPLLGTTTDLLLLLTPVLQVAVDLIDAIPDPVLQAAAAIYTMNKALTLMKGVSLLAATSLGGLAVPAGAVSGAFGTAASTAPKLTGGLRGLTTGLSGATLAAGVGLTAMTMYSDMLANARAEGEEFGASLRASFDPSTASADELQNAVGDLDEKIAFLKGEVDDSFLGRNTVNKDFNEALHAGIDEAEAFREEIIATQVELRRLEAEAEFGAIADEFVGVADAMSFVRGESTAAASAISDLRHTGDLTDETFLGVATTFGDAALSEEAMAEAARALGTDVESLTAFITDVNEALDGFIDTALTGLPEIAGAFRDSNDDAKVSAREFITGLNEDALELATFFGDIKTITEAGFAEVAGTLAEQGAEVAGAATHELAEAARKGNVELLLRTQEGLNNRDTAIANSTAYLESVLGPEFVLANGTVAREATEAFGANFDPAEQVRIAGELASSGLDEQGQRIAAIAATQGSRAAREFGEGLNMDDAAIAAAVAAGEAIRANAPTEAARTAGDDTGTAFGDGMIYGIRKKELEAAFAAQGLVGAALIAARKLAGINSPSTVWAEMGGFMGEGLALGLEKSQQEVVDAAEQIVKEAGRTIEQTRLRFELDRMTPQEFAPSLLVRANDSVPDDLIPWFLRFDNLTDALLNSREFPTTTPSSIAANAIAAQQQVTFEAGAIVTADPEEAADAVLRRLRAETFLQRRS